MDINSVFERLWADYTDQSPSAKKIHDLFINEGEEVVNDHIAFRTIDFPETDIGVVARPFTANGYIPGGEYIFAEKHLFAQHFENPQDTSAPRVFISKLILADCSPFVRQVFADLMRQKNQEKIAAGELIFSGSFFDPLSFGTYNRLREESEYAAWFYVFGFRANHFTVSVNSLRKYATISEVNDLIKASGFSLNTSGGEIKGTPSDLLEQSSTMADIVSVSFLEGVFEIPSCYYEFARRYPGKDGRLYGGFNAKSADKIFESTNFYSREQT